MTELIDIKHANETHLLDVNFLDLNTNETARFAVPGDLTLQRAWDMAYDELGETQREADILESRSGQALTSHLGETVKHIKEDVVHDLKFQIHGEQGGA
jgi:hypothetical protein